MISTERYTLTIPQYAETFNVSDKQRAKLYKPKDKVTKTIQKLIDSGVYEYRPQLRTGNIFLYNRAEACFVVKNLKTVGKPKVSPINSQIFWEGGAGMEWTRIKIKAFLANQFEPFIISQLPNVIVPDFGTFIHLEYIFWYPFNIRKSTGVKYQDYINHFYVRGKVFEDVLTNLNVIKDDNPDILRGAYARYINVDTEAERRLEIKIHFCKNDERIC